MPFLVGTIFFSEQLDLILFESVSLDFIEGKIYARQEPRRGLFLEDWKIWKENRKKLREQANEMRQMACVRELTERFRRYGRIIFWVES